MVSNRVGVPVKDGFVWLGKEGNCLEFIAVCLLHHNLMRLSICHGVQMHEKGRLNCCW